jgi:hypothetical protein
MKRLLSAVYLATALLPFAASVVRAEEADEKKEQEEYGSKKGGEHWKTKAGDTGRFGLPTAVVVGGAGYLILRRRTRRAT